VENLEGEQEVSGCLDRAPRCRQAGQGGQHHRICRRRGMCPPFCPLCAMSLSRLCLTGSTKSNVMH